MAAASNRGTLAGQGLERGNGRQPTPVPGWHAPVGGNARVAEAILPENDDDAVRIMTIHAAKGLEFPIAIVSGMPTAPQARHAPAQVVFPPSGSVGYRFSGNVTTEEYETWKPIDEQMSFDERIRHLYVACTQSPRPPWYGFGSPSPTPKESSANQDASQSHEGHLKNTACAIPALARLYFGALRLFFST